MKETATILAMGALNGLHIGPLKGGVLAKSMAVVILAHAQREPGAVLDPSGRYRELPIKAGALEMRRFVVTVDGENWEWTESVDKALADLGARAAVVVDLHALAVDLVRRADKPLWTVREVQ
ncbi:hypothetical protein [uncultured Phenylobacterium sp.]|uniref:hypothetical protein n=1 Tax=uncultured Phenylobacterium sp. TaxID=349273 RepID=UPI0025E5DF3D|nr:hypothetical protein [uncultured Phenylobacterium sp.]